MTQIVSIPGQGDAEFPDSATPEQIQSAIRKTFPVLDEKAKKAGFMDKALDVARGAVDVAQAGIVSPITSALGAAGGALGATAGAIKQGEFGTPQAAERISQGAAEGAEKLTPQATSQTGQEALGAIGGALESSKLAVPVADLGMLSASTQAPRAVGQAGRAVGGAVARPVTAVAGKVADVLTPMPEPRVAALAKKAVDLGIPLRPDQLSKNPIARMVGEALEKVPLSGSKAKQRQIGFNRSVGKLIGAEESDHLTPDVYDRAMTASGEKIGEISAQTPIRMADLNEPLESRLKGLSKETMDARRIVSSYVNDLREAGKSGVIDGTQFRKINSEIGAQIRRTPDGDLRHALSELQSDLHDALENNISSPEKLAELKDARKKYAIGLTIEPLVAKATTTGDISPGGLLGRVTADKAGKRRMARGQGGELGDLAEIGKLFLKEPASSGSAERVAAYGLIGGAGYIEPHTAAGAVTAANIYNRAGPAMVKRALRNVESKRAETRPPKPRPKAQERQHLLREALDEETTNPPVNPIPLRQAVGE